LWGTRKYYLEKFVQEGKEKREKEGFEPEEEEVPPPTWKDFLAFMIAAYQVVLPMVFITMGALIGGFLVVWWILNRIP